MEQIENFSGPVDAPEYVDRRIAEIAKQKGIEFRHRLTAEGMSSKRIKGDVYLDRDETGTRKIIEIPLEVPNTYMANCAILHEIARLQITKGGNKVRYAYAVESGIWQRAASLRAKCNFPEESDNKSDNWDHIRNTIMGAFRRQSPKRERVAVSLANVIGTSLLILGCIYGVIAAMIAFVSIYFCGELSLFWDVLRECKTVVIVGAIALVGCAIAIEVNEVKELNREDDG